MSRRSHGYEIKKKKKHFNCFSFEYYLWTQFVMNIKLKFLSSFHVNKDSEESEFSLVLFQWK